MRAYRIPTFESTPEWQDVPVPVAGFGQVVIRVAAVGLCHSDLAMQTIPAALGESLGWVAPFTLGHEISGYVHDIGEGVDGLTIGEGVAVASPSCGHCWFCVRGESNNCVKGTVGRGFGDDGGLAAYVLVKTPRDIVKLGGLDPVIAAPLTDAGATAFHGVNRVRELLGAESTAVVIGAGGLGSFAVQFLRVLTPARVIAFDMSDDKLNLASELGAHEVLEGVGEATVNEIRERTAGRGADVVLDFVGIDATINAGVAAVRPGGAYGLVGAGGGSLSTPGGWYHLLPRDGQVFSYQGSTLADAESVIALAGRGLITSPVETFNADQVEEAYTRLHEGNLRGRAVITFD
ncbi:alcohol dehydrogenase catalytic domain-containing protein [Paenarthrobacter histidinolovorans]|uniref:alcohol dehydrogenase catalytic domain-containing protein n=1 Tax=Paenarthrobacter histidinolovorans TaxID=43664 RepID=UPI00166841F0|nr:alcohol dehydrogenase catalytic domain-containing protein [Paenarthrobacter histidinolovorans]GGJ22388.1 oxidoreductase [Paenarthrobacter histidinolovorans]